MLFADYTDFLKKLILSCGFAAGPPNRVYAERGGQLSGSGGRLIYILNVRSGWWKYAPLLFLQGHSIGVPFPQVLEGKGKNRPGAGTHKFHFQQRQIPLKMRITPGGGDPADAAGMGQGML